MGILKINNKLFKFNNHLCEFHKEPVPVFDEVQIGNQIWSKPNLAIDDGEEGIYSRNSTANGYDFGTQYYYTYAAAMRIANKIPGWHLPSKSEYETLIAYCNNVSKSLRSTYGWDENGYDTYNLTLLPVDEYWEDGWTGDDGKSIHLLTSTLDGNNPYKVIVFYAFDSISIDSTLYGPELAWPVRLIKD